MLVKILSAHKDLGNVEFVQHTCPPGLKKQEHLAWFVQPSDYDAWEKKAAFLFKSTDKLVMWAKVSYSRYQSI